MTAEEYKKAISIAQEIHSLVHANVPPTDDAGTVKNLSNLINDLTSLRENIIFEEKKEIEDLNQYKFNF